MVPVGKLDSSPPPMRFDENQWLQMPCCSEFYGRAVLVQVDKEKASRHGCHGDDVEGGAPVGADGSIAMWQMIWRRKQGKRKGKDLWRQHCCHVTLAIHIGDGTAIATCPLCENGELEILASPTFLSLKHLPWPEPTQEDESRAKRMRPHGREIPTCNDMKLTVHAQVAYTSRSS